MVAFMRRAIILALLRVLDASWLIVSVKRAERESLITVHARRAQSSDGRGTCWINQILWMSSGSIAMGGIFIRSKMARASSMRVSSRTLRACTFATSETGMSGETGLGA